MALAILAAKAATGVNAAQAATVGGSTAAVAIERPVSIVKLADLDFGSLTIVGSGTAILNPTNQSITTTGGVRVISGPTSAARFQIKASRFSIVFIHLPSGSSILTRVGGSETMNVDSWTLNGFPLRLVAQTQPSDFNIGATLHANANQVEGTYTGQFEVTVDYL